MFLAQGGQPAGIAFCPWFRPADRGWQSPPRTAILTLCMGRVDMSDKSPQKSSMKKPAMTLKEKRAAKKAKQADKPSAIPPTGH
jgi:hypothetical protein